MPIHHLIQRRVHALFCLILLYNARKSPFKRLDMLQELRIHIL